MASEKAFNVQLYAEKFSECGEKLNSIRASSVSVRNYDLISKEYKSVTKSIDKMTENGNALKEVRTRYQGLLKEKMEELMELSDVMEYVQIYSNISDMISLLSQSMRELKKSCPELHAWIALNKKRAYYEDKLSENASDFKCSEALKETRKSIANFRLLHKESVDKWEEMYKLSFDIFH